MKYYEYFIKNDQSNNILLFCHKISQWIKNNTSIEYGISFEDDTVCIRSKTCFDLEKLETFLNKKIPFEEKSITISEKNTIILNMAFLNNHYSNFKNNKNIKNEDINERGFLPNIEIINNQLCFYITKKPITPLTFKNVQINKPAFFKIEYTHENKIRKFCINTQSFLFSNTEINDIPLFFDLFIKGVGVKKSYGFSKIEIM